MMKLKLAMEQEVQELAGFMRKWNACDGVREREREKKYLSVAV